MEPTTVIISCTQKSSNQTADILLYQSFEHGGMNRLCRLEMIWENVESLPVVYNRKIREHTNSGVEFLVFVHDDVYIDDLKLNDKLTQAYRSFGFKIIGVVGATELNICFPTLWHLMADKKHQRGFVHQSCGGPQTIVTNFGPTPSEVLAIDGLFMAVHLPSIIESGWRFNEKYRFHHYDISGCLDASKMGLKIGVFPIHLVHLSKGLRSVSEPEWRDSSDLFLSEYGANGIIRENEPNAGQPRPDLLKSANKEGEKTNGE
jgi:hypothetical protein